MSRRIGRVSFLFVLDRSPGRNFTSISIKKFMSTTQLNRSGFGKLTRVPHSHDSTS